MYFPWIGMLEQVSLADVFVYYDDVQYSKGGFLNRVQFKTAHGCKWLSIPLRAQSLGQRIEEVSIDDRTDWRSLHRELLRQAYLRAPFREDMLGIFDRAMSKPSVTLADVTRASTMALLQYFSLHETCRFIDVASLVVSGASSERVLDVTQAVGGNVYVTGHGARHYLNHDMFECAGVEVRYMEYRCTPYPQLHGEFTPYVTALDLVANCGKDGRRFIQSEAINWKRFLDGSDKAISGRS
jgi:hypothetical protein